MDTALEQAEFKKESRILLGFTLIILTLLVGGYFFWERDIARLSLVRKNEARIESEKYYEGDALYTDGNFYEDIPFDDSDFTTLDIGI